ncbi:hypothetical protein HZP39_11285 [Elizabethkingia anophelis]|uniref:GLPGLI family protein n=1 Tax=Elizabethkingia anophelis R26 TaxID=1246994 RepID=A0ABM6MTL4_9FLAO|nr:MULTISPECIES: hypothetical protein [Elizabethkingia]ATC36476.1 hypothetical protein BAZ09_009735 [Elizabethkingia anophelis R26]ATC40153.1 hypothetical protein EAAG1_009950 [Elizabethkingia anophelis Ag1]ATC43831.1 hypothetical protein CMV41_09950 [Elizabethkingia anophelis]ATC47507.1 hypothetical protein CMV40_09950 [Elizabethkingia anophelis]ELR78964.1 hypothetical protein D505_11791 [Elizabethkingia anophelis R26]
MKKTFSLLFSFISLLAFSQMQTYKLVNAVSYRIKDDFYSNFLNIFSTPDYSANLFVVATPMGNTASLNVGNRFYAVYSDDGKVFKIAVEDTIDRNKYKNNDDPDLDLTDFENTLLVKRTNKKETIKSKQCDVYSVISKDSKNNNETICIDTTSRLNTVPFIIPAIKDSVKGLVYRIGNKIELNYSGTIENMEKKEEDSEDDGDDQVAETKQKDLVIQFDEKAEIENYKKEYNKKNKRL